MTLPSKAKKVTGPYKGSKDKDGRKTVSIYDPKTQKSTSMNYARYKKEKELGRKLGKDEHVDHKDGNHMHDGGKNLKVMKASDNIAKGNTARKHKKKKVTERNSKGTK